MQSIERHPRRSTYVQVTEARERVEIPTGTLLPIRFKDGTCKTGLVPYGIEKGANERSIETLNLQYKKFDGTLGTVDLNTVTGIDVVKADEEQLILFTYFNPKLGMLEESPREIVYKDIFYGVHPNHAPLKEFPDFYVNADDMQYPKGQRDRTFPFWRMGIYGDPVQASEYFMP
jgi:hypothetical protein